MDKIYPAVKECDVIVFATPLYYWNMSGLLYYDHLMEHLKWENLGHVLAGGNGYVGDIEGKPELQKAYELGKSIQ